MPQHKSNEKRMRTSARQRTHNRIYRSQMKKAIRKVREAKSPDEARASLGNAIRLLDRLAGKGIIHPNRAADKKSRLHAYIRSLKA